MAEVAAAFGIVVPAFEGRGFLLKRPADEFVKMFEAAPSSLAVELVEVFSRCKEILDGDQRLHGVSGKSPLELHRCDSKCKT